MNSKRTLFVWPDSVLARIRACKLDLRLGVKEEDRKQYKYHSSVGSSSSFTVNNMIDRIIFRSFFCNGLCSPVPQFHFQEPPQDLLDHDKSP